MKKRILNLDVEADRVIDYIVSYVSSNGYPPSVRNISDALDLRSPSTTHKLIRRCVSNGYIEVDEKIPRAIRITKEGKKFSKRRLR